MALATLPAHCSAETIPPVLHTFPVQDVYVWRHEQGTLIEMQNEEEILKRFNEARTQFKAWVIAPIPGLTNSFTKSWLLLVKIPPISDDVLFPSLTDNFTIDLEAHVERPDGNFSLVHLNATRVQNPYEDIDGTVSPFVSRCAAFRVDVPRSWQNGEGTHIELDLMSNFQTASGLNDYENIVLDEGKHQNIIIMWDTFSLTFEAELAALRRFIEDPRLEERELSMKSKDVFKMIQNFHNSWRLYYNLHEEFPHLKNPEHPRHRIPAVLLDKFRSFNADHRSAYDSLAEIPNGLFFVNGCPGAGKTEWNMVVSALIQCKRRPGSRKKHSPILFVVDLNKTVDDAADRYFTLCKEAGLKLRIVRMHGWPYEMRNSTKLNEPHPTQEGELDFTRKFMTTISLAKHAGIDRNPNKAPTLDEAAWDYYEKHKRDCFTSLNRILTRMEAGEVLTTQDWKTLRSQVTVLYRAVLAQTDFIATTPVAAYGGFSKLFRPDVVFVDEAPHARELTTLIPIAFFEPIAWILTGDVNQTRPFVKGGSIRDATKEGLKPNPHAAQLRVSLMARAEMVGAINSKLLVNKRAHGNLHRLPSDMFYQGGMSSGYEGTERYPPTVVHLKNYLQQLGGIPEMRENRAIIRLTDSKEERHINSFWNPTHHKWLVEQVQKLLGDPQFRSIIDNNIPGSVMIQSPYSTAVRMYLAEVKQWPQEWQDRVEVLTVDKAQGNQADVVFLDMVRSTTAGFMNEPQRLNVAITRARQAEVILMHYQMTWRTSYGRPVRAEYTSQIWDDAAADRRVFVL
ncbi:P-loop containing nucleoside triphosphate hydrolase protein [Dactylonectria macrodidyma]|uniref:P-loop containing nucleoside triphosphate hydrolase protein n=1 Tax=Dactylonectria macrodidyma TaxID=307937 RepID=A0A9P9FTQ6_9HYPO|nr:P-loop containing nucleoside triphosphate hydrolase protein [Dactylonectria macrodidyma]